MMLSLTSFTGVCRAQVWRGAELKEGRLGARGDCTDASTFLMCQKPCSELVEDVVFLSCCEYACHRRALLEGK